MKAGPLNFAGDTYCSKMRCGETITVTHYAIECQNHARLIPTASYMAQGIPTLPVDGLWAISSLKEKSSIVIRQRQCARILQ